MAVVHALYNIYVTFLYEMNMSIFMYMLPVYCPEQVPQQPLVSTASLSLLDMLTYPEQLQPHSAAEAAAIRTYTPLNLTFISKRECGACPHLRVIRHRD